MTGAAAEGCGPCKKETSRKNKTVQGDRFPVAVCDVPKG